MSSTASAWAEAADSAPAHRFHASHHRVPSTATAPGELQIRHVLLGATFVFSRQPVPGWKLPIGHLLTASARQAMMRFGACREDLFGRRLIEPDPDAGDERLGSSGRLGHWPSSVVTDARFEALRAAAVPASQPILLTAYDTGMRLLPTDQVDLEEGVVKLAGRTRRRKRPAPQDVPASVQGGGLSGICFHDLRRAFVTKHEFGAESENPGGFSDGAFSRSGGEWSELPDEWIPFERVVPVRDGSRGH